MRTLMLGPVFRPRTEALPVVPRPSAEASLDSQASKYFALLDASLGGLQERAQELINILNSSRKEDHSMMRSFRESLLLKVGARGQREAASAGGAAGKETPAHASPSLPCGLCLTCLIALFCPN